MSHDPLTPAPTDTPEHLADMATVLEAVTAAPKQGLDVATALRVTTWILDEMADTFLVNAFSRACDECYDAGTPHPNQPPPGGDYGASMPEPSPEVRDDARRAAVRLYAAILRAPGGYDPAPALVRWHEAGHRVRESWWRKANHYTLDGAARCWGHYAVMEALCHGVSWEDDNEPLTEPPFRRNIPAGDDCPTCGYLIRHGDGCPDTGPDIGDDLFDPEPLPSVGYLDVRADDLTWEDECTERARAALDARDARIAADRALDETNEARREAAEARRRARGEE